MKTEYPRYNPGELDLLENQLSSKDNEALAEFLKKCSITACPKKVIKIKKIIS